MTDRAPNITQDKKIHNSFEDNDNGNWVKEHRRIKHHRIWKCAHLYQLWRFLIMEAKWDNDFYSDGKIKIPLKRGQLVCSLSYLEYWLGMSRSKTHSKLKLLRNLNAIETEVKQGITVITICNYDKYQCTKSKQETDLKQIRNTNQNAFETESDPSKELKKERRKEIKNKGGRFTPLENEIWISYFNSFTEVYGVKPLMTKKTASQLRQLTDLFGDMAPDLVSFYSRVKTPFYVSQRHSLDYCIKDAEKLHTAFMQSKNT